MLENAPPRAERAGAGMQMRTATVLFVDLCGFARLTLLLEDAPDLLKTFVGRFYCVCKDAVLLHNGFVVDTIGDCVLAVFGAPRAFDQDALNAARAAFSMRQAVRVLAPPARDFEVECSIGIATGEISSSPQGWGAIDRFDILGPTVNLAARLQGAANAGQIVIDRATAGLVEPRCESRPVGPLALKNVADAYMAVEILGLRAASPVDPYQSPGFVGRENELKRLIEFFTTVSAEKLSVAQLTGEAGVGKTRLVGEWLQSTGRAESPRFFCESYQQNVMFGALVDWLRGEVETIPLPAEQDPMVRLNVWCDRETWTTALPPADRLYLGFLLAYPSAIAALDSIEGTETRRNLFRLLRELLAGRREETSTPILVFENAQWLDPMTIEFLKEFSLNPPQAGMLLVLTGRPELDEVLVENDLFADRARIEVSPLPLEDRRRLLDSLVGAERIIPEGILERIDAEAGGYPLFLIQLAEMLREQVDAALADDPLALEYKTPDLLQQAADDAGRRRHPLTGLLQSRIDRLDAACRDALLQASVIGRNFSENLLRRVVASPDGLEDALARLRVQHLLQPARQLDDVQWSFVHGAMRDTAYAMLPTDHRRAIHTAVARGIESLHPECLDEMAEVLAFHYETANDPSGALPYLARSANHRREIGALGPAVQTYQAVVTILENRADELLGHERLLRIRSLTEMGVAQRLLGRHEVARTTLERAANSATNEGRRAFIDRVELETAILETWMGENDRALGRLEPFLERMARADGAGDEHLTDIALSTRGILAMRRGDLDGAFQRFEAIGARHRNARDRRALGHLADALNNAGLVCWQRCEWAAAEERFKRALDALQRLQSPFRRTAVVNNLGIVLEQAGRISGALHYYRLAVRQAREIGYLQVRSAAENNLSNLTRRIEDPAAAIRHARRAVELTARLGDPSQQSQAWHNLALALSSADHADPPEGEIADAYATAMRWAEKAGDEKEQCWIRLDRLVTSPASDAVPDEKWIAGVMRTLRTDRQTIRERKWSELEPLWQCAWTAAAGQSPAAAAERRELAVTAETLEQESQPLEALACRRLLVRLAVRASAPDDEIAAHRQHAERLRRSLGLGDDPY
jgi:adenylate cyclase